MQRLLIFFSKASNGHEACVDALLHNGADVTSRDVKDRTPLHMAAICGHVLVLTVLIEVCKCKLHVHHHVQS